MTTMVVGTTEGIMVVMTTGSMTATKGKIMNGGRIVIHLSLGSIMVTRKTGIATTSKMQIKNF